ncbi:MAG: hypothetical protein JHC26_07900 [Thermofilum sp.]|nr:hypothetical protein [Thermofilum sp.]MCI4409000.1 hypothetical protein [Thermofilum sp.]
MIQSLCDHGRQFSDSTPSFFIGYVVQSELATEHELWSMILLAAVN